jgi:hypothetical protein
VVKRIDEVSSELQLEPLREKEVLMQTQVHMVVMRSTQTSELWGAVSKCPYCRVSDPVMLGRELQSAREPREFVPDVSAAP